MTETKLENVLNTQMIQPEVQAEPVTTEIIASMGRRLTPLSNFEEVNSFFQTVHGLVTPMLDRLESRLRAEFAINRMPASTNVPLGAPSSTIVYKTPSWVYVGLTIALLLSLIALSR